ncbi:MAG: protein-disulfide reductase DsbD N-terminal domain-containing protein, partial [Burkholderiaceae bacterium]
MTDWPTSPGARSRSRFFFALLCLLLVFGAMLRPAGAQDDFLDPEDAFRFSAAMSAPATLDVHFAVAPEYYMYRERFELEAPEGVVADTAYPPGLVKYDPTFE